MSQNSSSKLKGFVDVVFCSVEGGGGDGVAGILPMHHRRHFRAGHVQSPGPMPVPVPRAPVRSQDAWTGTGANWNRSGGWHICQRLGLTTVRYPVGSSLPLLVSPNQEIKCAQRLEAQFRGRSRWTVRHQWLWWTIRAPCSTVLPREQPVSQAQRRRRISPRLIRVLRSLLLSSKLGNLPVQFDNAGCISTCIQRRHGLADPLLKMHGDLADTSILLDLHITSFIQILGDK